MQSVAAFELCSGEGRPGLRGGQRIVDWNQCTRRVGVGAEIAHALGGSGNAVQVGDPFQRALTVVVGEVEELVFLDRSRNGATELTATEGWLLHVGAHAGEGVSRIDGAVADVGKDFTMKAVRTEAGRYRDDPCASAEV